MVLGTSTGPKSCSLICLCCRGRIVFLVNSCAKCKTRQHNTKKWYFKAGQFLQQFKSKCYFKNCFVLFSNAALFTHIFNCTSPKNTVS